MSLCSRILVLAEGRIDRRGDARRRAPRPQGDRGLSRALRHGDDRIRADPDAERRGLRLRQDDDPERHQRQHPARRHHHRHRPQRRRQVDHVQDGLRAARRAQRQHRPSTAATPPTSRRGRCSMPACATCRRAATSSRSCRCGTIWSSAASRSPTSRGSPERVDAMMQRFPMLREKANAQASTLSGGQQKLLEVARGLLLDPKLMLIDEPSIGLSPQLVQEVFAILKDLRAKGVTILLIEQNARQALQISDYGLVLEQGQTRIEDTAPSILADPRIAQLFLGGGLQQRRRRPDEWAQKPGRPDRRQHHELAVAGAARGRLRRRRHPRPLPPDGPRPPARPPARAICWPPPRPPASTASTSPSRARRRSCRCSTRYRPRRRQIGAVNTRDDRQRRPHRRLQHRPHRLPAQLRGGARARLRRGQDGGARRRRRRRARGRLRADGPRRRDGAACTTRTRRAPRRWCADLMLHYGAARCRLADSLPEAIAAAAGVVNATPVGMQGIPGNPVPVAALGRAPLGRRCHLHADRDRADQGRARGRRAAR